MKTLMRRMIAGTFCALSLSFAAPIAPAVYAAKVTVNEDKKEQEAAEKEALTFKERLALEAAKQQVKVSAIPEGHAYIPEDVVLKVELTDEISSKKMHKGDPVPLILQENLIINDVIVVPAGTAVEGVVTEAKSSGRFGRSGKLEFSINSVKALNGVKIPLEYTIKKEAGSDGGAVAVATAVSLLGGFFMKGKNVNFPAGSTFEARVTADTDLNVTLEELADAMDPNKPHGVSITIK